MGNKNRARVTLHFQDGEPISAWESFKIRQRFTSAIDSFQFTVSNVPRTKRSSYLSRLSKGEIVSLEIDGKRQATAVIVSRRGKIGPGWTLEIDARGLLHAANEASVDPYYVQSLKADAPLRDVVFDVLEPFGFDEVTVDSTVDVQAISGKSLSGRAPPVPLDDLKLKDVKSQHGQSAYAFLASLFTRFGAALRTDRLGRLLLTVPDYDQSATYTVSQDHVLYAGDDLMLQPIEWEESNEGQFSFYVAEGKASNNAGATSASKPIGGVVVPGLEPTSGPYADVTLEPLRPGRHLYSSTAQPYKPRFWHDKKSRDKERCLSFARCMQAARGESGFSVRHAVDGFISRTGAIWTIDTVGRVVVADAEIDENMWLFETTKIQDRSGGQRTELVWIPLYALDLRAS